MSDIQDTELSPEAAAFADWIRDLRTPETGIAAIRTRSELVHSAATEPEEVTYKNVVAAGVPGIWASPIGADTEYVLLHSHAGGSVVSSADVDRKLAGHIAKAVGVPTLILDWRRAPEDKYPAQVDDVEAAYEWLLSQGYPSTKIILIGHSIGGFLSVALPLRLRDSGRPLPGAIVAISPWCDLEISNATIESNAATDSILSRELLELFRESWIGGTGIDASDPLINLNRSDLSGLPPTLVSWGTFEVLAGEDEEFAEHLVAAGVDTHSVPVPGGQHSYVYGAGNVPETDTAIAEIARWVRSTVGISD